MRKVLLAALLFCGLPAFAATQIVFTWTNSNSGLPTCTTTITTTCLTTYTLTDTTSSTVVSSTIASSATTYTYVPVGGIPFGYSHSFSLTISGKDSNGNVVTSAPATAIVINNVPNAPTGLTVVVQ